MLKSKSAFTIVELLIVIVVIAILAAISIVAYNGIQGRARDSQRLSDMKTIVKALEIYKITNGVYPPVVSTANASGWETSTNGTSATNFLSALISTNGISKVPVDPVNTGSNSGTAGSLNPSRGGSNILYFYYRYAAGANGCDASKGDFYVLGVSRMDTVPINTNHPQSPGFSCSGLNWATSGAWVTGAYTNG